jgi:hypothetical protein
MAQIFWALFADVVLGQTSLMVERIAPGGEVVLK